MRNNVEFPYINAFRVNKLDTRTTMDHHLKRFLFNWYAAISTIAILIAAFLLLRPCHWKEFAAIAAVVLSFAFGVQKQNLEEIKLFKMLFEQFNGRYDEINDDMNQIYRDSESPLTEVEIKTLFKYFNLCGEEYLYYREGFICHEVWHAWNNGMKFFRQNPRISRLWDLELKCDSYYGLSF
jgi:hypothetical protein